MSYCRIDFIVGEDGVFAILPKKAIKDRKGHNLLESILTKEFSSIVSNFTYIRWYWSKLDKVVLKIK